MASEIRANKSTNRAGLGTVTYADTGIIVSGIVTCTELSGLTALNISGVGTANTLDINGDIDVDGHTNLDNVSIAGIVTTTQFKVTTGANAFETSANVFKGASGQKGVYLRSALSSATTPSYSSVDDTNTGIFLPGSDVFAVTTGGTERLRITIDGDIIAKSPTQYKGFTLRKADGGTVAQLVGHASDNDEGGLNLWDGGTKKVQILANGTSYLNGGTVGINDSSPNTYFKLDVNGHTNIVGDIALPTTNRIYWGTSDTAFIKGEHGGSAYLSFGANNEKMRLTRAGYLGIGTDNPQDTLDISRHANHGIILRRPAGLSNPGQISLRCQSYGVAEFRSNRHMNLHFDDDNSNNQFFRIYSDDTEVFNISSAGLTTLKNFNGTGLKLEGAGSNYQGMQLQTTDSSASQTRNIFIDTVNETGAAVANQVGSVQADGGSMWSWSTQPPGDRTDRRVERLRITANGKLAYNYDGTNVSTVADVDIRSNSGVHIRGADANTNNTNIYISGAATNQRKCAIIFDPVGGYCRGDLHFCMDNTGDLSDVTVSDTKMVMKADGKIGIGIDNPAGQLHVSSGTLGDCVLILEADTDNNQENDNPYIEFRQDGGIAASVIGQNPYNVTDDNNALFLSNSISNGAIIFKTGNSNGHSNATERLRIKSDGTTLFNATSVNAGGAAPKLAIDVGDSNLHGVIIQAGGGENGGDLAGLAFVHGATGTIARPKAAIALNASGSYGRGDLCFYVDGASDNNAVAAGDERMRIKSDGSVIISNSNPPASGPMMHVTDDGSATTLGTTSTFRVSNDGGSASYSVFEAQSGSGSIRLANDGQFYITGFIKSSNQLFINNTAPTIYLQDSDHHAAMIHQNSNLFYVLRASGSNSTVWSQYNSQWPMYLRMTDNKGVFGGNVDVVGSFASSTSDRRLKKNLVKIQTPLEKISKLTGYNFDWNDNVVELGFTPSIPTNDIGLIAQDVQEVAPQAVAPAPFDLNNEFGTDTDKSKSGENYLTVKYEKLVPLLVEAIKELKAEVDALKSS